MRAPTQDLVYITVVEYLYLLATVRSLAQYLDAEEKTR